MNAKLKILSDRSQAIMEVVNELVESWSYDLSKRKPGIAYVDDAGRPITDLDAACFMSFLADKRGVINVSMYKGMRAKQHTAGEVVVSSANRHGKLNYLTSNQKVWSFGFNFKDFNVMTADTVGKDRSFAMQGMDGEWYPGWDVIDVLPTGLAEDVLKVITDDDNKAYFKYFVHPMRWVSVFGESFRVAKYAADYRLADRIKFLKSELSRIRKALEISPTVWAKSEKEKSRGKMFWAYESFIDGVPLTGEYKAIETTQEAYTEAKDEQKRLESIQRTLRFHVRASEFAWWQHMTKDMSLHATNGDGDVVVTEDPYKDPVLSEQPLRWVAEGNVEISKPVWAKDKTWKHGVGDPLKPTGRTLYAAMEMEEGIEYRFRAMPKSEQVAL